MRWALAVFIALLVVSASGFAYLRWGPEPDSTEFSLSELQTFNSAPGAYLEATCIIEDGDIRLDTPFIRDGNVVIISRNGDIHVDATLGTAKGHDGSEPTIYEPSDSIPHHYVLGESGRDAGDVILLAPRGTIHVAGEIRPGDGGRGLDASIAFSNLKDRQEFINRAGDQHVYVYGGYGGFGGDIFLGAPNLDLAEDALFPGAGGRGGDATINGATIHDIARAGHGGMGGQAYWLADDFLAKLTAIYAPPPSEDSNAPAVVSSQVACEHPIPFKPNEELPAQILQPAEPTCAGGHGGNALTTGLYGGSPRYGWDETVAGTAVGGNGGWGCPGGNGGNARSFGATGADGPNGRDAACDGSLEGSGESGVIGTSGGIGGHAFGGDGGAGLPGQMIRDTTMPNPLYWFFGWGPQKLYEYSSDPSWPIRWEQVPGQIAVHNSTFHLIGDDEWYRGGNGGTAVSHGGDGGRGGDGGHGRNGPSPGEGGTGGRGGAGAAAASVHGGWGAPGSQSVGRPGALEAIDGDDGLNGVQGDSGRMELLCSP